MTLHLTSTAKTFPDGTKALLPTDLTVSTGEIVSLWALLAVERPRCYAS